ncbi:MAG: type I-B CRISPR-associated protein Cas8b1/Cst1 [Clostridia bacterium]
MKTRIYLREWFYNAGIVGFLRILEKNQDQFAKIGENYIEFETEKLKNFASYYFNYFFEKYNIAKKVEEKLEKSFRKIEQDILTEPKDRTENKAIQGKIKTEKKYIKQVLKTQMDKIKKFDEQTYEQMLQDYNAIDTIEQKEEIEKLNEIQNNLKERLNKDNINKRLTMNLFKSILSKSYFGQPSFLNVVKTALSYEEQQEVMYKDYISNIIETAYLQDILENRKTLEEIETDLEIKLQNNILTDEVEKVYHNIIKKYIEKNKDITEIQSYIKEKVFSNCYMCENANTLTSSYSESNFVPLAISSDNMKNFFWNQNAEFPVCDICKLILFCIPAGITSITKTIKENGQYKEKEVLSFVNYDTDVENLVKYNNNFGMGRKIDKNINNPYSELILNIVEQDEKISEWQLQNIFVVEFETEYLAFSRMEYFNIKRYVAKFFKGYAKSKLNTILDYKYKLEIVDAILKNKEIQHIINRRLREELQKENRNGYSSYLATQVRTTLEILKKEESNLEEKIEKANNKLKVIFILGNNIYAELKKNNNENKLDGYIYKMLNSIKGNRKDEFIDTAIRVIWSSGKDIPEILIKNNEGVDWKELGHSFIAGLTQAGYIKNEEVKENE